jgi:hypothetical protein
MKHLFQYAVLLHEYDEKGNYTDSKIIVEPKTALAKSEKDLVFKVTREIPEEFVSNPDNVQILVKVF